MLVKSPESRICKNSDCNNCFFVKHGSPQKFCSHHCSARVGNLGRKLSFTTRLKISRSILLLPPSARGHSKTKPKIHLVCSRCGKRFWVLPYLKDRKYCGSKCASRALGRMITSPKASKGKNGFEKMSTQTLTFTALGKLIWLGCLI